jgi:hypothetical protein
MNFHVDAAPKWRSSMGCFRKVEPTMPSHIFPQITHALLGNPEG